MPRSTLAPVAGLISLGIVLIASAASAQTTTAQAAPRQVRLSLAECRQLALENNLDLRVNRLAPVLSNESYRAAHGTFDPQLSASASFNTSQPPDDLQARFEADSTITYIPVKQPSSRSVTTQFGVTKRFGFGTSLTAAGGNTWSRRSGNTNVQSYVYLSARQPLLDGLGRDANEGDLVIARNSLNTSLSQLRQNVTTVIRSVEQAYWNLVSAHKDLDVSRLSLQEAERLLETSRTRAEIGTQTQSDVIDAEANVAERRHDIIAKRAAVRDRADELRQLLNLTENGAAWDTELVPVDTPSVRTALPPVETLIQTALESREDIQQTQIALQSDEMRVRMTRNSNLPTLDVTGRLQLSDSDRELAGSIDNLQEFRDWRVGVEFSMPIGNHSADAAHQRAIVGLREDQLRLASLQQSVQAEVRSAYRNVESTREQIASARIALRLYEARLDIASEKLRAGLITNYDVIQAERDLAAARKTYLSAQIQHQNAIVALDAATGVLLRNRRIQIEDPTTEPRGELGGD